MMEEQQGERRLTRRQFLRRVGVWLGAALGTWGLLGYFGSVASAVPSSEISNKPSEKFDVSEEVDAVFSNRDLLHEEVVRRTINLDGGLWDQPIENIVTKEKAGAILTDYHTQVETNPSIQLVRERTRESVKVLMSVLHKLTQPADFSEETFPNVDPNQVSNNLIYMNGDQDSAGGGLSAVGGRPAIVILPLSRLGPPDYLNQDVEGLAIANGVHESLLHPLNDLVDPMNGSDADHLHIYNIAHAFFTIWTDLALQKSDIGFISPELHVLAGLRRIQAGGMLSNLEAWKLAMRMGLGIKDDVVRGEKLYVKGRQPGDPESLTELVHNFTAPAPIDSDDEFNSKIINSYRKVASDFAKIPFVKY